MSVIYLSKCCLVPIRTVSRTRGTCLVVLNHICTLVVSLYVLSGVSYTPYLINAGTDCCQYASEINAPSMPVNMNNLVAKQSHQNAYLEGTTGTKSTEMFCRSSLPTASQIQLLLTSFSETLYHASVAYRNLGFLGVDGTFQGGYKRSLVGCTN